MNHMKLPLAKGVFLLDGMQRLEVLGEILDLKQVF